ncbi:MAG: GGDEF domain-containing protein [Burkholderiales bacterium]|nr:GGDEF domain-containing protein [Burkholderiales bacterium]
MRKLKATRPSWIDAELDALRAGPQVQSIDALGRAENLLDGVAAPHLSNDELQYALRLAASGCQSAGRWLDGLQFARRLLELAQRDRNPAAKIPALAITSNIHSFLRNYHLALRSAREALDIAEAMRLDEDRVKLMQALGTLYSRLEMRDRAVAIYERAAALCAERPELASVRAGALNNLAGEYRALGRIDEASATIARAAQVALESKATQLVAHVLHTRAEIRAASGDVAEALDDAAIAAVEARKARNVPVLLRVLLDSSRWLLQTGRVVEARNALLEATALTREVSLAELRESIALARLQLEQAHGDPEQAVSALADFQAAREDLRMVRLESQRIAVQFVEEVADVEARGKREAAAVSSLTLRLIESQAEAQRISRQAARDPLTGALNRNAFDNSVSLIASGEAQPVALLMLDIDNFRSVNSTYGHLAGDAVLEAMVSRVRRVLRTHDLLGRYGGDEFVLLCPNVGPRTGAAIASRVLAQVSGEPVSHDGQLIGLTVSVGVAAAPSGKLADFAYVLKRADAALRRAKIQGKNRAVTVRVNA